MRKVTYEVSDGERLSALARKLDEAGLGYHLWIEQPYVLLFALLALDHWIGGAEGYREEETER